MVCKVLYACMYTRAIQKNQNIFLQLPSENYFFLIIKNNSSNFFRFLKKYLELAQSRIYDKN